MGLAFQMIDQVPIRGLIRLGSLGIRVVDGVQTYYPSEVF